MSTFTPPSVREVLDVAQCDDLAGDALLRTLAASLAAAGGASSAGIFELDLVEESAVFYVGSEVEETGPQLDDELEPLFWSGFWDSVCSYTEPGSRYAAKVGRSDVLAPESCFRTWREYAASTTEYVRRVGLGRYVIVPLSSSPGTTRRLLIDRAASDRGFSADEILALRLLQPHVDGAVARARATSGVADLLSPRELEILAHARAGHSAAAIARLLWVQPSTVRKHLENAYAKLGVHSRMAAVAVVFDPAHQRLRDSSAQPVIPSTRTRPPSDVLAQPE